MTDYTNCNCDEMSGPHYHIKKLRPLKEMKNELV